MRKVTIVKTPTHRLLDQLLGEKGPLEAFVASRRADGMAWRLIARELYDITHLDVTYETLRSWFPEDAETVAKAEQAS